MTWSPYEFDDDSMTIRSWDAADIGRLLRELGIDSRMTGRRICTVYVSFVTVPLTPGESDPIMSSPEETHVDDQTSYELPF